VVATSDDGQAGRASGAERSRHRRQQLSREQQKILEDVRKMGIGCLRADRLPSPMARSASRMNSKETDQANQRFSDWRKFERGRAR